MGDLSQYFHIKLGKMILKLSLLLTVTPLIRHNPSSIIIKIFSVVRKS